MSETRRSSWSMPVQMRSAIGRYALVAVFVFAALAARIGLGPWLGSTAPFLTFFPAILLAAVFGGFGPGLLATVLAALVVAYQFLPPGGFAVEGLADVVSLVLFAGSGAGIAWVSHLRGRSEAARRAEATLALDRAERFEAIIDTTVDAIIVIDSRGRIETFNRGAERMFGYSEAEVLGRNVNLLMPSPYREEHDRYLERYLTTGVAQIIGIGREATGCRRDGSTFPVQLAIGEMAIGGEKKFTGVLHDLTQRARLEERLREQTSLARLGEMAAVVAHEVKNPLAGIRGAIQVIGSRLTHLSDVAVVKEIVARIDALDQLMKELLLFARPPQPKRTPIDVRAMISSTAQFLSEDPSLRHIHVAVDGNSPPVLGDADMLKIVFQNLLINSAHAMKDGGAIRVEVGHRDSRCQIVVSDSGPGIPVDVRDKIFQPFFTTKARGTGLGLPTAKRLVEAHDGSIAIDCPPGGGTTVRVELPLQAAS